MSTTILQSLLVGVVGNDFRTHWDGRGATAAVASSAQPYPQHCELAVVGAGWGGVYLAYRLAVDTHTINASSVCVFEANGRAGGRIFSIHGLPHFADLAVDVGGYRFQETQRLPADLVWSALELPTACYDWDCARQCEGTTCHVIKDAYGNNAGYATAIERMLERIESAGAGVHFAATVTAVTPAPSISPNASRLTFATGQSVTADTLVLNMPRNAIEHLSNISLIFSKASPRVNRLLSSVLTVPMVKIYAWYDDAWWSTKLGRMEGSFNDQSGAAPLEGRYHDGPQRCVIGKDTAGEPVYSGHKVRFGNCSGALEVYYGPVGATSYYRKFMAGPLQPLTVVTRDGVAGGASATSALEASRLLEDVHAHLMSQHGKALRTKGVDPASIAPPQTCVLANWISDGLFTPGIGSLVPPLDAARAAVRKPAPPFDVYVVNQDYGYETGWAVGSLIMAEKVLQAEMGLPKPSWLDAAWYEKNVVQRP